MVVAVDVRHSVADFFDPLKRRGLSIIKLFEEGKARQTGTANFNLWELYDIAAELSKFINLLVHAAKGSVLLDLSLCENWHGICFDANPFICLAQTLGRIS